jgi:hypothetical protein
MSHPEYSKIKLNRKAKIDSSIIIRFVLLFFISKLIIIVSYISAYRPFIFTDAAVAAVKEWEIELGLLNMNRDHRRSEIFVPSLRINYGILKNWEIVGEFDLQVYKEGKDRNYEFAEPAIFLKGVLHEGVLQDQEGLSFVVELGVLLPSTIEGERKAGLEGIIVFSGKMSDLGYHINLGGELDREDFAPHGLWGIILEYPFEGRFRLVGEVNGSFQRHGPSENSGLIGLIWEIGGFDLDFGIRKGFSAASSDWALTTGISVSF